ncbi:sensor domain-containing diguanylate cyclase [Pseudomonas knackmussii]|uniref:sensor domain-containing diguanylate cyclase n=1 Tax=Pseudomonas knackmussii TaxID=65741 RepID=UPI003BE61112
MGPSAMLFRRPHVTLYISLALAVAISALTAAVILQMRQDALAIARDSGHNIALLVERDLKHNLDAYDLALNTVLHAYREPSVLALPATVRNALLQDYVATTKGMGSIFLTDENGKVIFQFGKRMPQPASLALNELFASQRIAGDDALHISQPFLPLVEGAQRSIAVSRRLTSSDGSFAGVVVATLELDYLREQFSGLSLGKGGEVTLRMLDGTPLVRWPVLDTPIPDDRDTPAFSRFLLSSRGDFIETSHVDGQQSWYSFRRVGNYPLVFSVALPEQQIFLRWRLRAWTIGLLAAGLDLAIIGLALLAARQMRKRTALVSELREEAHTDALTGLNNRRAFDRRAAEEWSRTQRSGEPLALLMLDIDMFKAYNDHYGHPQGDVALRLVAQTIGGLARRPSDFAARYGGEEFVVLLGDSDLAKALALGEQIRAAVQARSLPHERGPLGILTLSVGVASTSECSAGSLEELLEAADGALYRAKSEGRNRVASYSADAVAAH